MRNMLTHLWAIRQKVGRIGLILIALALLWAESGGGSGILAPSEVSAAPLPDAVPNTFLYLPMVYNGAPHENRYGTEIGPITNAAGLVQMTETRMTWIRKAAVWWPDVEPTEGSYNWAALSGLESELTNAYNNDLQVVLVVRGTPDWAQTTTWAGHSCSAIRSDKFAAFATFLSQLVTRYRFWPYHVTYWELGNEPDADPADVGPDSLWGCWGDKSDPVNYGGDVYADMLKVAYPAIKAANPQAQVLIGGLLMDCDPDNPPTGKDCSSSHFLDGILGNGGGPYFDGVSFHAYDYYADALGGFSNSNWNSSWDTTGTATTAKTNYLKSRLAAFSVSGKDLLNTEAAVLCVPAWGQTCDSTWETTKAYYVARVCAETAALDLRATFWYYWPDRNARLVNSDLSTTPAYDAYTFSRQELDGASYLADYTGTSGVAGYKFTRGSVEVWVLWSLDGASYDVTLSGTPSIYDVDGDPVAFSNPLSIGLEPYYLEY